MHDYTEPNLTILILSEHNPCSMDLRVRAEIRRPPCIPCTQLLCIPLSNTFSVRITIGEVPLFSPIL